MIKAESNIISDEISEKAKLDSFLNSMRRINKFGLIYFDEEKDRILHVTTCCKIYFEPDSFWKIASTRSKKTRTLRTLEEIKESLNQSNFLYLGDL